MNFATDDERILANIARTSFLSLWSLPNLFRNQGDSIRGGDGKELCDLVVIFGDCILLFSDKRVEYKAIKPEGVAWARWEKRAVVDSIKQLRGAERWIRKHPNRIFTDKKCKDQIPISLKIADSTKIYRIAVTHGLEDQLSADFGEASLSYSNHEKCPFTIFSNEEEHKYCHVLSGDSLHFVLNEIDTTLDFIGYLNFRTSLLANPDSSLVTITKESDIVHLYFKSERDNPALPSPGEIVATGNNSVLVEDVGIKGLLTDQTYQLKKQKDAISYFWDKLIEHFIKHSREGTSILSNWESLNEVEKVLRRLATSTRFQRRLLSEDFWAFWSKVGIDRRGTRITFAIDQSEIAYVFLLMPEDGHFGSGEQYRITRQEFLKSYVEIRGMENPDFKEIVGIAAKTRTTDNISYLNFDKLLMDGIDYVWIDNTSWTDSMIDRVTEMRKELTEKGYLKETKMTKLSRKEFEPVE